MAAEQYDWDRLTADDLALRGAYPDDLIIAADLDRAAYVPDEDDVNDEPPTTTFMDRRFGRDGAA